MPLKNGYLDIRVSQNPDYPGLNVTYISDNPYPGARSHPRVTIETPYDVDTGGYNLLRALIWANSKSKKYNYEISLMRSSLRRNYNLQQIIKSTIKEDE